MNRALLIFHDELNDLLPPSRRGLPTPVAFREHQTVKHLFESLGIPHTEVSRVIVNGQLYDFSFQARDGDQIELYPFSSSQRGIIFHQESGGFLLDMHLGKLARKLRLLGFDTVYFNQVSDPELSAIAEHERRTLLTRDRRLLMRKQVVYGYCVRDLDPARQIEEVLERFDLLGDLNPFIRCPHCNSLLLPASKAAVIERLEPLTRRYFEDFRLCPDCGQVYWDGSHVSRVRAWIEGLTDR